ncbi:MAG: regulatory protein RecX [Bacteroidales bacterium]
MTSAESAFNQLQQKAARFCAWRERCSSEVEEKLRQLGASAAQQKKLIQWLQQEGYLNDARFARSFARGKFANNHWGRIRIAMELKARHIENTTIEEALIEISENQYLQTMEKICNRKWEELEGKEHFERKQKTAAYLAGKGYELNLVWQIVEKIASQNR